MLYNIVVDFLNMTINMIHLRHSQEQVVRTNIGFMLIWIYVYIFVS